MEYNINMETEIKPSNKAKDFIINFGAMVALYTLVITLINLLFIVIDRAYPPINSGYYYFGSESISWPVSILVIFFPILILLMWLLEKEYTINPEKQSSGVHRWATYVTLFLSGLAIAIDLSTVLYYFIDGQELTKGFILKVLVLLVILSSIFTYYVSDLRGKLTAKSRIFWRIFAGAIILSSVLWGFSVLGSPRTQRLLKYDQQKISDLQNISSQIGSFYSKEGYLPNSLDDIKADYLNKTDSQNKKPYEYEKLSDITYNLCADFNKESPDKNQANNYRNFYYYNSYESDGSWLHKAGRDCLLREINPEIYFNYKSTNY